MDHNAVQEYVVRVSRRMSEAGLVVGTSGNVSARTPDGRFLVTPSGHYYAAMEPEDTVLLDLDAAVVEPSFEWPMHAGIYRARPEILGIVHTHARYATYGTEELARNVASALGASHTSCLLANHGTIAVGASFGEAYSSTELLEEMAEIYYRARAAREPVTPSPAQIAEFAAKLQDYGRSKPSTSGTG